MTDKPEDADARARTDRQGGQPPGVAPADPLAGDKAQAEIDKLHAEKIKIDYESAKLIIDTEIAKKQANLSLLASFFAPLVPIASLLTVIVTLVLGYLTAETGYKEASEKRIDDQDARDAAKWEAFEKEADSFSTVQSSPTFIARLQEFSNSAKHSAALKEISRALLSKIDDNDTFTAIWNVEIKEPSRNNIDDIVNIAKSKKKQYDQITEECGKLDLSGSSLPPDPTWTYLGICSPKYTRPQIRQALDKSQVAQADLLRSRNSNINNEVVFLSGEMAAFLRNNSNTKTGPMEIDMSDLLFNAADLQGVDFSKANLSGTIINASRLDNVLMLPNVVTYQFMGSTWWDAAVIDQTILPTLIEYNYPKNPAVNYPASYDIAKEAYVSKVKKLCTSHQKVCSDACIVFGPQTTPYPAQCVAQ